MSTLTTIRDYYTGLDQGFNDLYFDVLKAFDVKAVHDMRVNIKKQTAFFHLLESIDPNFEANASKAIFLKIYKNAGEIRKIHIEQAILSNDKLDATLVKKLHAKLAKKLRKSVDDFLYHNNTRSLLAIRKNSPEIEAYILNLSEDKLFQNLHKYFKNLISKMKRVADLSKKSKKAYHDLRKLLKELTHNFNLIKSLFPNHAFSPELLEYLNQLQSNLGNWHDLFLTLKSLRKLSNPPHPIIKILKGDYNTLVLNIRKQLDTYDTISEKLVSEINALFKTRKEISD